MPEHHIDFSINSTPKHWYGPECEVKPPKFDPHEPLRDFFASARYNKISNLTRSLYFNIVEQI